MSDVTGLTSADEMADRAKPQIILPPDLSVAPQAEPTRQSRASLLAFVVILVGVMYLSWLMIAPYLITIFMGGILAVLVQPLFRRLVTKYHWRPNLAALAITALVIILVVGPLATISGLAVRQAIELGQWVSDAPGLSIGEVLAKVQSWGPVNAVIGDATELQAQLKRLLQSLGTASTGVVIDLAKQIPDVVLQLFISCLTCYFFLLDGRTFVAWLAQRLPLDAEVRTRLGTTFKDTAISVIWASMAAAAAQAVVMALAFAVLGVPAASLAGGATFVFAWIPILGSTPVWLSGAAYLYLQGSLGKMAVMLGFGVFTGILDNFVRPLVLKGRGEMHPLVSLVAIFGGIQLFGIVGVFFGPIVAALVITLLQVWPTVGHRAGLDFGR